MCLANYTRRIITFDVNLLSRFSSEPTECHWIGLAAKFFNSSNELTTYNICLFYAYNYGAIDLVGYVDYVFLLDPHRANLRRCLCSSIAISQSSRNPLTRVEDNLLQPFETSSISSK